MHNELTRKDIELMKKELDERRIVLRPKLLEAVKEARAFGDLSENFEYKAAKQEKNRNESRIRFLENMIRTAHIIDEGGADGGIALYDKVTVYLPARRPSRPYQPGVPSGASPAGKACGGHRPHRHRRPVWLRYGDPLGGAGQR